MGERRARVSELHPDELVRVRRAVERLQSSLRALLHQLPPAGRSIGGMGRHLGVHRSTCQRVIEGIVPGLALARAVELLPGTKGLDLIVGAVQERVDDASLLRELTLSAEAFGAVVRAHRSKSKLEQALRSAELGEREVSAAEDVRRRLFESIRDIEGEDRGCMGLIRVLSPDDEGEDRVRNWSCVVQSDIAQTARARPVTIGIFTDDDRWERLPPDLVSLVPGFSTPGLVPTLSTTNLQNNEFVLSDLHLREDLVTCVVDLRPGVSIPNPIEADESASMEVWLGRPCRNFFYDLYIHKDLAGSIRFAGGAYRLSPQPLGPTSASEWHLRHADSPDPVELPGDIEEASALYPRYAELIDEVFSRWGHDRGDFVGYGLRQKYPIYSASYRMYLEPAKLYRDERGSAPEDGPAGGSR